MAREQKPRTPYIVFFGGEGSGKSTQVLRIKKMLEKHSELRSVVFTREPGGTKAGSKIRDIVLHEATLDRNTRMYLFLADKIENTEKVVRPAMENGTPVLQDRGFVDTMVYNLQAEGLEADEPLMWEFFERYLLTPSMAILLDVSAEVGLARKKKADENYYERKGPEYHRRIIALYQKFWADAVAGWFGRPQLKDQPYFVRLMQRFGGTRWVRIDADLSEDQVFADVSSAVLQHLQEYEANVEEWNRTQTPEGTVATTG